MPSCLSGRSFSAKLLEGLCQWIWVRAVLVYSSSLGAFLHTSSLSYQGMSVKVEWWCFFHSANVETGTGGTSCADNRPEPEPSIFPSLYCQWDSQPWISTLAEGIQKTGH